MQCEIYCVLLVVLAAAVFPAMAEEKSGVDRPTARQVVERIKQHLGIPWSEKTVNTFKAGDPETPVTGIATTFLATIDVLERAAAAGKNLVITHEPTFYQNVEQTAPLGDDAVLAAKRALIAKHKLVVWRFHDHWHRRACDGILEGAVAKLGWAAYQHPAQLGVVPPPRIAPAARHAQRTNRASVRASSNCRRPRWRSWPTK